MEADLSTVKELIESLNAKDQREILATLNYQFSEANIAERWTATDRHAYDALLRYSDSGPPLHLYLSRSRHSTYRKLKRQLQELNDFATEHSSRDLKVVERVAVLNLVVECLADYIRHAFPNASIRPDRLLRHLPWLRAAVNAAFPGAAASKLLDRIAATPVDPTILVG